MMHEIRQRIRRPATPEEKERHEPETWTSRKTGRGSLRQLAVTIPAPFSDQTDPNQPLQQAAAARMALPGRSLFRRPQLLSRVVPRQFRVATAVGEKCEHLTRT